MARPEPIHVQLSDLDLPVDITRFEDVKSHLMVAVINREDYANRLDDIIWEPMEDLAKVYRVDMEKENEVMSAIVSHSLIKSWGITEEQLDTISMNNTLKKYPPCFFTMTDMINLIHREETGENIKFPETESKIELYVLTNSPRRHGAGLIAFPQVLQNVKDKIGEDVYIIPSSKHEVLMVPKSIAGSVKELEEMVRMVNSTVLDPADYLSNHVYEIKGPFNELKIAHDKEKNRSEHER